jgi:hypothetical protein
VGAAAGAAGAEGGAPDLPLDISVLQGMRQYAGYNKLKVTVWFFTLLLQGAQ